MSSTSNNELPAIRHPRERVERFFAFDVPEYVWTVLVGGAAFITANVLFSGGAFNLLLGGFLLLWIWTMKVPPKRPDQVKSFNDRRFMYPVFRFKEAVLKARKGYIWKVTDKERAKLAKQEAEGVTGKKDRRVVKPFPVEAVWIENPEDGSQLGLAYHQGRQTYSMAFEADGGRIPGLSRLEQYYGILQFASIFEKAAAAAGAGGVDIGISVRYRPQDPYRVPEMMLEIGSLDTILPRVIAEAVPREEWTLKDEQDVILAGLQNDYPEVTISSLSVDMVVMITMKENSVLRKASQTQKISPRDLRKLPLMRVRNVVLSLLKQQATNVRVLDLEGMERFLRKAIDATDLPDYYDAAHDLRAYTRRREAGLEEGSPPPDVHYDRYLPREVIRAGEDHLWIDNTWISVLDLTSFPGGEAEAHDVRPIYDTVSRWSSLTLLGHVANNSREYTLSNWAINAWREVGEVLGRLKQGPRSERLERQQDEFLQQMDDAGLNMDYVIRFATLASDPDQGEEDLQDDFDRFNHLGFGPVRVEGYSLQQGAALSTLMLIDCE